jgi:hypothetical protein
MKARDKERVYSDLIKYCNQIGIFPEETPMLIFDKKEMAETLRSNGHQPRLGRCFGECFRGLRIVYIDSHLKYYQVKRYYKKFVRWKNVRFTYRYQRHCLVHELVHYRFHGLQHGKKFEQRINEIIAGERFEPKHVENTGFKWTFPGMKRLPNMSRERQVEVVKVSAEFLSKHKFSTDAILQELKTKYGKYINEKEIETGFNLFLQKGS